MKKTVNNRAWLLVAPVMIVVLFSALLPMMTVVSRNWLSVRSENFRAPSSLTSGSAKANSTGPWRSRGS